MSTPLTATRSTFCSFACAFLLLLAGAATSEDTCLSCHSDPEFRVSNPALYEYHQNWLNSPHMHAGLSCVHCHGGDPTSTNPDQAHHPAGEDDIEWATRFRQIPETCGSCHSGMLREFSESRHSRVLRKEGAAHLGPNCVTCHGAMQAAGIGPDQVLKVCGQCHLEKEGLDSSIPERTETLLGRLVTIRRFQHYIALHGDDEQCQRIREQLKPRLSELIVAWHGFDLDRIDELSRPLLDELKQERELLRGRFRDRTPELR